MSTSVDNRVVKMEFDNANFEKNAKTTLDTLENLHNKTNFSDTVKEFEKLGTSAKSVNFDTLNNSINTVKTSFSALQVAGYTALSNIVTKAQEAGEQIVKSLALDQVSEGWNKYAQLTKSSATMVAQGFEESLVAEQVAELQWFADETSYSLSDMTDNVSKFTAAGLGLEESTQAMEGIALWAALSGQNSTTAARAMYQLSQAISAGAMRLADYKSIQNANMDTQEFRQKCLDAAVAAGTLSESVDELGETIYVTASGKTFNISQFTNQLTEDLWLTSDIMMEVFQDYSGGVDQIMAYAEENGITASEAIEELGLEMDEFQLKAFKAGQEARSFSDAIDSVKDAASSQWASIFTTIFGGTEDSIALWTDLANRLWDIFVGPISNINNILSGGNTSWEALDGRTQLIKGFVAALDGIANIQVEIGSVMDEVFGSLDGLKLLEWTNAFKKAMIAFRDFTTENEDLHTLLVGIANAFKLIFGVISAIINFVKPIAKSIINFVYTLAVDIAQLVTKITEAAESGTLVSKVLSKIQNGIVWLIDHITELYTVVRDEAIIPFFNTVSKWITNLSEKWKNYEGIFGTVRKGWTSAVTAIKEFFTTTRENISAFAKGVSDGFTATGRVIKSGPFSEALTYIKDLVDRLATGTFPLLLQVLDDLGSDFISVGRIVVGLLSGNMDIVFEEFNKIKTRLVSFIDAVVELIFGVGDVTAKFKEKLGAAFNEAGDDVKNSNLYKILKGLGEFFSKLIDLTVAVTEAIASVFRYIGDTLKGLDILSISNIVAGLGISKLAKSLSATVNEIKTAFSGPKTIVSTLNEVKAALKSYQEDLKTEALKKIATSILEIAAAMWILGTIDSTKLLGVCGAMAEIATTLGLFYYEIVKLNSVGSDNRTSTAAKGLMNSLAIGNTLKKMASSFLVIAAAMAILGSIDTDKLQNAEGALALISIIVGSMYAVMAKIQSKGSIVKAGAAIDELAGAILVISVAMKLLARMELGQMAASVAAFGLVISGMVIALTNMSGIRDPNKKAAAIVEMAAALLIVAIAIKKLARMNVGQLAAAVAALGAVCSGMVFAMNMIPGNKTAIQKGAAFTIMATGLIAMAAALRLLNNMSLQSLALGVAALGALMASLMFTTKDMTVQNGGSLLMMSAALILMADAIKILGAMDIASLAKALGTLVIALAALMAAGLIANEIPAGLTAIAAALAALGVAAWGVGKGFDLFVSALQKLKDMGSASVLRVFDSLKTAFVNFIKALITVVPAINEALLTCLEQVINFLITHSSDIAIAITSLLTNIALESLNDLPDLAETFLTVIIDVLGKVIQYLPDIINKIFDIIVLILKGLAERTPDLVNAVFEWLTSLFTAITNAFENTDFAIWRSGLEGLGIITLIMTAVSVAGAAAIPAMIGLIGVAAFIAELGGFLALAGLILEKFPGIAVYIEKSYPFFEALGKVIGGTMGTLCEAFCEPMAKVTPEMVEGAKSFAQVAIAVAGANVLTSLSSFVSVLTGDPLNIRAATSLSILMEAFIVMGKSLKKADLTVGDVAKLRIMATCVEPLVDIANNLPKNNGLWSALAGQSSISGFGAQLAIFVGEFILYVKALDGITTNKMELTLEKNNSLIQIVGPLAELASSLQNHGGVFSWFTGDNKISSFGKQLATFVEGFNEYFTTLNGIANKDLLAVKTKTESLVAIVTSLNDMAKQFEKHGGFTALFNGDNKMDKWGSMLASFTESFTEYTSTLLNNDAFTGTKFMAIENRTNNMVSIVTQLNNLAKELTSTNTAALVNMFNTNAGETYNNFGQAVIGFVTSFRDAFMTGEDVEASDTQYVQLTKNAGHIFYALETYILPACEDLATLEVDYNSSVSNLVDSVNDLTGLNEDDLADLVSGETLINFSAAIASLGAGMADMLSYLDDYGVLDFNKVGAVGRNLKTLIDALDFVVGYGTGTFLEGMLNGTYTSDNFKLMADFGQAMQDMTRPLRKLDQDSLTSAVNNMSKMIELLNGANEISADTISVFNTNMSFMASNAVSNFVGSLDTHLEDARQGIYTFLLCVKQCIDDDTTFETAMEGWAERGTAALTGDEANEDYVEVGKTFVGYITSGAITARQKFIDALNYSDYPAESFPTKFAIIQGRLKAVGESLPDYVAEGIRTTRWHIIQAINGVLDQIDIGGPLADLNSQTATEAIDKIQQLIDIFSDADGFDFNAESVANFAAALGNLATEGLATFSSTIITGIESDVRSPLQELIKAAYQTIDYDERFEKSVTTWGKDGAWALEGEPVVQEYRDAAVYIMNEFKQSVWRHRHDYINTMTFSDYTQDLFNNLFSSLKTKLSKTAEYLCEGLAMGIHSNRYLVVNAMKTITDQITGTLDVTLKIHSPSRVMKQYGQYITQGLALGITAEAEAVEASCEDISTLAMNGMQKAIAAVSEMVENGMDTSPVIRPVMDLTEIQNGTTMLSDMITNATSIPASSYLASGVAYGMSKAGFLGSTGNYTDISQMPITNTFNITGDNPKEIANEVSRILQKQVERSGRKWG